MRLPLPLVALAVALAWLMPAAAWDECVPNLQREANLCVLSVCTDGAVKGGPAGTYYLSRGEGAVEGNRGWYLHEESNSIDGLQRYDEEVDDTCGGAIPADTRLWHIPNGNPIPWL